MKTFKNNASKNSINRLYTRVLEGFIDFRYKKRFLILTSFSKEKFILYDLPKKKRERV